MPNKPMTKKQWTEYVTKTFTDCVESAYKDLIDEAVLKAVLAEREQCIMVLERLHERSGEQHNYYKYAANVLRGEK